ncbi:MAG: Mut7-C RNAse domain-containing protein [Candidatus Aminicenantes bacterium]|nr:MAG: Mut7-C RNAse domain-containing protein [Candidatus Aminicenantes bacterium]
MRFVVDCMLGKLAKWLKILGFDTLFFSKIEDDELLIIARKEERVLLTKDTGLIQQAKDVETLFLESEEWKGQIQQVMEHFNLKEKVAPHTRCIDCNVELKGLPKKNAKNLVSSFVFEHADSFALCPSCGRVFWRGSHFKDMEVQIEEILNKKP